MTGHGPSVARNTGTRSRGEGYNAFLRGAWAVSGAADTLSDRPLLPSFPTRLCRIGQGKRLVIDAVVRPGIPGEPDPKLIKLLVRAHYFEGKAPRESGCPHRR